MHAKQKGNIGHLAVSLAISKLGLPVFTEIGDLSKTDLITIYNDTCVKIQVKYAVEKANNSVEVPLRKSGPSYCYRYKKMDFDVMAVYAAKSETVLYLPNTILDTNSNSFVVRFAPTSNKQTKGVHNATDFLSFYDAYSAAFSSTN